MKLTPKINQDLTNERKKCSFNTSELTHLLDGGADNTKKRKEKESFFLDDLELMGSATQYLTYQEKHEEMLRKLCVVTKKLRANGKQGMKEYRNIAGTILEVAIFKSNYPLFVHYNMFVQTIETQGTEEQQKKWLDKAIECNIIGTYAQTEMGHGSFIRGVQTTSTYDPLNEEFILNTPDLTSYKWWPGLLGNVCNYAVVLAQLYSQGKACGIHFFFVQLRDEKSHEPLPGIKIGDIGIKSVMTEGNHGYLAFQNVRIPRENMLMKNNKILKDGTYVESINNKLTYGAMIHARVKLIQMTADNIRRSITIAVRYNSIRRQSQQKLGEPETQIIDYVTQQYKLFPHIAACLAFTYCASWLEHMLKQVNSQIETGALVQLAELHALSSCFKAVTTSEASVAVETCRFACGGHGYMICSGFPILHAIVTPMLTFEGENTILLLQTARFLMKQWTAASEGGSSTLAHYFNIIKGVENKPFRKSIDWIVWTLEQIVARKIDATWQHLNAKIKRGVTPEDAWNLTSIELVQTATVYAETFIVKIYSSMMATVLTTVSQPLKEVLLQLLNLYAVHVLLKLQSDLLRFTDTDSDTIQNLHEWLEELLSFIRPNAVGLVDSFDLHNEVLSSALGAFDGNVYEKLFEESLKSPLNTEVANKRTGLYVKEIMKSKY